MYRYSVDESLHRVVATFEGEVCDSDLFDYLADMLANTRYRAGWRSLLDFTTVATLNLTTAGVQRMRALPLYMDERLRGARGAILAPEGSAALDMARMYERMGNAAAYNIVVFTDRERAMRWLLPERDVP